MVKKDAELSVWNTRVGSDVVNQDGQVLGKGNSHTLENTHEEMSIKQLEICF